MKILILNGPNLNMLGKRDKSLYGHETLEEIRQAVGDYFPEFDFKWVQSNLEGELIDSIQAAASEGYDGLVANPGGFSHTSVALRDAFELLEIPKIEVHLSNIHAREEFRKHSITGSVMDGVIAGFGSNSYILGIKAVKLIKNRT